jgi:hypothetical protein
LEVDAEGVLGSSRVVGGLCGCLCSLGWGGAAGFGDAVGFLTGGTGPGGWRWQAADDQPLGGPVGVALNPHGWDPADLVVEAGSRPDADTAEVAGAQVRDGGSPAGCWRLPVLGAGPCLGERPAEVQDVDANQCALALADPD